MMSYSRGVVNLRPLLFGTVRYVAHIIGASLSKPNTSESNGGFFIGVSLSKPHTCDENGKLSIYIYICGTCIFRIMHSALFVRDAIFPQAKI